jgi:hypothetical protein
MNVTNYDTPHVSVVVYKYPRAKVLKEEAHVGVLVDVEPRMLIANRYGLADRQIQFSQNGEGLCPLGSTVCFRIVSLQNNEYSIGSDSVRDDIAITQNRIILRLQAAGSASSL